MAKVPTVALMMKCKVNGKWRNLRVQISANGRPKAVPGARFYLRYNGNRWEPVGKDFDTAMVAKRRREISLETITGVSVAETDSRRTINTAIAQYLDDTEVQKEPRTFAAYKLALKQFRDSCSKTYLDDVDRRDLLNLVAFLDKLHKEKR